MDKQKLRQVIIDHQELFKNTDELIDRNINIDYFMKGTEIVVISGIRRCGKSSLLKLIAKRISGTTFYLNFDDVRLTDFTTENFQDAQNIAHELSGTTTMTYFLDEIQNVHYWERWVNTLYELKNKTLITGSNAGLLSSEIATHL